MEHTKFCQSCGMPLTSHEAYGTLASGEKKRGLLCPLLPKRNLRLGLYHGRDDRVLPSL